MSGSAKRESDRRLAWACVTRLGVWALAQPQASSDLRLSLFRLFYVSSGPSKKAQHMQDGSRARVLSANGGVYVVASQAYPTCHS